ncbi:hypothetical protein L7F22_060191 [Adiantum nelumboides]|nr:hypothetical protein [Adiantum nelumboides]
MPRLKAQACAQESSTRGKKRCKEIEGEDVAGRVMEVSVTISTGGGNIDVILLACMDDFLKKETCAGICSVERCGVVFNLHFQMVAKLWAKSFSSEQESQGLLGLVGLKEAAGCTCAMAGSHAMQHAHISWDGGILVEGMRPAAFLQGGAQH